MYYFNSAGPFPDFKEKWTQLILNSLQPTYAPEER